MEFTGAKRQMLTDDLLQVSLLLLTSQRESIFLVFCASLYDSNVNNVIVGTCNYFVHQQNVKIDSEFLLVFIEFSPVSEFPETSETQKPRNL